ncbi:hypothetical protein SDRG_08054 [Saprolegnia diclina VS20]|uniref:Uncharacterized protein n=1 Tax=Saprolegnia diclina (strain VS20) TaxID=1156394 RepID=T0QHP7_SAPDV|nr:hypothetical protein SDRG_08054 [Saprolegnia diclina VS20]EQC34281.1 hypothetical protein SDRG_08054 [Saprolegnia diclina VS20]|eukprot:XP_008612143.1 hypothetical protein SDRG_08054 [Saprolegnia diclina VS20]
MGLHVSVMIALAAVALGDPLPSKNVTLSSANTTEAATRQNQFPTRQWGIQRGTLFWTGWMNLWTPQDQWTTISGSAVTTKCRDCDGSKAWEVYQSPESNKVDMLRNVHTDLCLDAYWSNDAGNPVVHGYPCNLQNGNQHWDFDLSAEYGWIRHRRYQEWILYGYDGDMIHIKDARVGDEDAQFVFVP